MTAHPILVLGASGSTGRRVTRLLRAAGRPVRPASRRGEVRFDWTEPRTWPSTVAGASRMYLMAPDGVTVDPAFVACAVDHGVRRFVLLSSKSIEVMGDERLMSAERTVGESGVEWTIVRSDWFDQNFDEGIFRDAVLAGEVALPLGDLRQVFVDADDIAAVAAAALTEDGHAGQTYEVGGPRALSFGEALDIIGRAAGRRIIYRGTEREFVAVQTAAGLPHESAMAAVRTFAALAGLGDAEPNDVVRRVTGRESKPFETYAAEAAARGAWNA